MARRRWHRPSRRRQELMKWRHALWARQHGLCYWCGGRIPHNTTAAQDECLTVDHLVPKSRGGTDSPLNLVAAHRRCNGDRGNKMPPAKGAI